MRLSNKRIIVVDDDPNFRRLVRKILEAQGMIVDEAENLHETYDAIEKNFPDIILLDFELSDEEKGSDFLLKRHTNYQLMKIPTIMCSAHHKHKIVQKMIDLGVTDFLIKPIKQDVLIRKIKKWLHNQEFPEYKFSHDEAKNLVQVQCWGELHALGEVSCMLQSPINFSRSEELKVNLIGLAEALELNLDEGAELKRLCRSNVRSRPSVAGVYDTFCTILGISEKDAATFRKLKTGWRNRR